MYYEKRDFLFDQFHKGRDFFIAYADQLIELEHYISSIIYNVIAQHYPEISSHYNESSYLHPFWAEYPPADRGRAPIGDQIPWIEVGEHAVGHKLERLLSAQYRIAEIGLPSGADNRFVLYSDEINRITNGFTNCAFLFLDIKSVGPRDNFDHTVISPYQASGDGIWDTPSQNMKNSTMRACGKRFSHVFYPAISPIYPLTTGEIAPTIHLFIKPIYKMLNLSINGKQGQPLECIKSICVPNGLLLTQNPAYLNNYPGLFFPGKDDKTTDPKKSRVRVSFKLLKEIAAWRVEEYPA